MKFIHIFKFGFDMFSLFSSGTSFQTLADQLNRLGQPSSQIGTIDFKRTMGKIIKNFEYQGRFYQAIKEEIYLNRILFREYSFAKKSGNTYFIKEYEDWRSDNLFNTVNQIPLKKRKQTDEEENEFMNEGKLKGIPTPDFLKEIALDLAISIIFFHKFLQKMSE